MKVDRLVSIIMILLDKERIGAQELAEMFEVSSRTIYRDIDTINMAGIPVNAGHRAWVAVLKSCSNTRWIERFFQQPTFPLF